MTTKVKVTLEEHVGWDVSVKVFDAEFVEDLDNTYQSDLIPTGQWIENVNEGSVLRKAGDSAEKYVWDTRRIEISEVKNG